MATPVPSYFSLTGDPVIDGMTHGYYWYTGTNRTIDWSISNGFAGERWANPDAMVSMIGTMLGNVTYYANVNFNYVGYYLNPTVAYQAGSEINVSLSGSSGMFPSNGIWARGFFPEPLGNADYYYGEAGDVFLNINSQANYLSTYAAGSAGWMMYMHELGHVLGLKHPHDSGGTGRPTLSQLGMEGLNIDWATMMAYSDDFDWNLRQWDPYSPVILDVLALQYIYGPNMGTNAGDSVLTLSATNSYWTYWDASGTDAVSAEHEGQGWFIALPSAQLSSLVSTKAGFAVPIGDFALSSPHTFIWLAGDIENAVGSGFDDVIVGSNASNYMWGLAGRDMFTGFLGDDSFVGGDGIDSVIYDSPRSSIAISHGQSATYVTGPEGADTLWEVERLSFSDGLVAIDMTGNAGKTAKLLGAVFGAQAVQNSIFVGIGLRLFDSGASYSDVVDLALTAALGAHRSNASVFELLYRNTTGTLPTDSLEAYWVGLLQSGQMTQSSLVNFAADMNLNLSNIGFIGLSSTGIAYIAA